MNFIIVFLSTFLVFVNQRTDATAIYGSPLGGATFLNGVSSVPWGWRPQAETYSNDLGVTSKRRCPLCDSSVFGYCGDKLFHDSCCCVNPNNQYAIQQLPYQCKFADCSFLHASSCPEHKLITACCCTNLK